MDTRQIHFAFAPSRRGLGQNLKAQFVPEERCQVSTRINPNVAKMCRGKTRQGAPGVASRRLGEVEAYFTVREILPEASTGADGVLWREFGGFRRFRFATLGFKISTRIRKADCR